MIPKIGCNRPTLDYLMRFLSKLCENSTVNKMSASNASIVFGPTLIRARVETIETTLNSPIVNSAVQVLIEVSIRVISNLHLTTNRMLTFSLVLNPRIDFDLYE